MYQTDNIAFAAFLIHRRVDLVSVVRNGRRVWWKFDMSESDALLMHGKWISSDENSFFARYLSLRAEMRNSRKR